MSIFFLPPSEWKKKWWSFIDERLSFDFSRPLEIASHATEKDLKCTWNRYDEWVLFNRTAQKWPYMPAIERYTGVMFGAIDYNSFDATQKEYFNTQVLILSGMYWLVYAKDRIANYKLPIWTKWLIQFWGTNITEALNTLPKTQFIDLLPWSYKKMIQRWSLKHEVLQVNFFQDWKKLTHAVKGVKGRRLRSQIMKWVVVYEKGKYIYVDEKWEITVEVTKEF